MPTPLIPIAPAHEPVTDGGDSTMNNISQPMDKPVLPKTENELATQEKLSTSHNTPDPDSSKQITTKLA